jgi:hypothetical protein
MLIGIPQLVCATWDGTLELLHLISTFPRSVTNSILSTLLCQHTMSDFLQSGADDIDFDRAASAFPDISLDGEVDFTVPSQPPVVTKSSGSGFSFDDFDSPPTHKDTVVKVTGDDEMEKFKSEFPDIDVGQVCWTYPLPCFESALQTEFPRTPI